MENMGKMVMPAYVMVAMICLISAVHAQGMADGRMDCMSGLYLYCYNPDAVPSQFNYDECMDAALNNYINAVSSLFISYCAVTTGNYESGCSVVRSSCLGDGGGYDYGTCSSQLLEMGVDMISSGQSPCRANCGCTCANEATDALRRACEAFDLPVCESMCEDTYNKCVSDSARYYQGLQENYAWCDARKQAPAPETCAGDNDCPAGKICAPDGSKCIDRWTCTKPADCPVNYTCVGGLCYKGVKCSGLADCPTCSGFECCQYDEFKDSELCQDTPNPSSCDGVECCQFDKYKNDPFCTCKGLDCCQYEEYNSTPLCVVPPTEEECAPNPPDCPTGGVFNNAPALRNTFIPGGGLCRGACGPDCPDTCVKVGEVQKCVADSAWKCFYTCTYSNTVSCGVHDSCVVHDDCYDACAANGETALCIDLPPNLSWNPLTWLLIKFGGLCHCACDYGCVSNYGFDCRNWMNGLGPYDYRQLYSDKPVRSGPLKSCPPGSELI